jgi:BolA protein
MNELACTGNILMSIQSVIEDKLYDNFSPCYLDVINDAQRHHSQAHQESYFKVVIVSNKFVGQRLTMRHRAITRLLANELAEHIQGLALHTYTEKEWLDYYADNLHFSSRSVG